jgi:sugar lactone lactonase YvrE
MRGVAIDSRFKRRLVFSGVLLLLAFTFPPAAGAYIYWGSFQTNSIGRADNDGSHRKQQYIGGIDAPNGLALTRSYMYWTNYGAGTIGRANLDGTHRKPELVFGAQNPDGLTVYGNYVYWANFGLNAVGRATLDGSQVNQLFIAGLSPVGGVAIRPPYIYWTNFSANTIGRANLDGSQPNYTFITGASSPDGLIIDGNQIYWSNYHTGTIGRANLDGSQPNQNFIAGGFSPDDLAIFGSNIYWVNTRFNSIGRARINGSGVNQAFLRTARSDINAVALDAGVSPPSLTNVKQSAPRWRPGNALPRFASANPPVGTTFSFNLDRSARVQFVFVKGSRTAATFSRNGHQGRNKLRFQGRINPGKRLAPGTYALRITAMANGRRSRTATLRFTIIKR